MNTSKDNVKHFASSFDVFIKSLTLFALSEVGNFPIL